MTATLAGAAPNAYPLRAVFDRTTAATVRNGTRRGPHAIDRADPREPRRAPYFASVRYDTRSLIGPISGPVAPGRVATCTTFSNMMTNGEFARTAFCSAS